MKGLLLVALVCAAAFAGPEHVLWREPGTVDLTRARCLDGSEAKRPRPPFQFVEEDGTGTSPKVIVRDAAGVEWRVKGGYEVHSETFATRFVSALGYFAEPMWYVASGRVEGVRGLRRASRLIHADGSFVRATFEKRESGMKLLAQDWAWNRNPFQDTRELRALKVVMMLLSNWDNKDMRNRMIGSNTGIAVTKAGDGLRFVQFVNDWGQTLGSWGSDLRAKGWDCAAFTEQSKQFVQGRSGDTIRFGFTGIHTDDFKHDITVDDVRWLLRYLDRITAAQMRRALAASGATRQESGCFTRALRDRIDQLRRVSAEAPSGRRGRLLSKAPDRRAALSRR